MTPTKARKILEKYVDNKKTFGLPVYDECIHTSVVKGLITNWTFRGLLKIAYKLKDD
jgi:hypothetical protein